MCPSEASSRDAQDLYLSYFRLFGVFTLELRIHVYTTRSNFYVEHALRSWIIVFTSFENRLLLKTIVIACLIDLHSRSRASSHCVSERITHKRGSASRKSRGRRRTNPSQGHGLENHSHRVKVRCDQPAKLLCRV
jgi:hypothetical protein